MSLFKKRKINARIHSFTDEYLIQIFKETQNELNKYDVEKICKKYNEYKTRKKELEKEFYDLTNMKFDNYDESKLKSSKKNFKMQIDLLINDFEFLNSKFYGVVVSYQTISFLFDKLKAYKKEINKRQKKNKKQNLELEL